MLRDVSKGSSLPVDPLNKFPFRHSRPRSCERGYIGQRLTVHRSRVRKNVGIFQQNPGCIYYGINGGNPPRAESYILLGQIFAA